jgi:hypothetical protein
MLITGKEEYKGLGVVFKLGVSNLIFRMGYLIVRASRIEDFNFLEAFWSQSRVIQLISF